MSCSLCIRKFQNFINFKLIDFFLSHGKMEVHFSSDELIDPRLGGSFTSESMKELVGLTFQCLNPSSRRRPQDGDQRCGWSQQTWTGFLRQRCPWPHLWAMELPLSPLETNCSRREDEHKILISCLLFDDMMILSRAWQLLFLPCYAGSALLWNDMYGWHSLVGGEKK
jgi:hypothetical protein